jgi:hypothetical protein
MMRIAPDDEPFLRRAIELAAAGRADGEAPLWLVADRA